MKKRYLNSLFYTKGVSLIFRERIQQCTTKTPGLKVLGKYKSHDVIISIIYANLFWSAGSEKCSMTVKSDSYYVKLSNKKNYFSKNGQVNQQASADRPVSSLLGLVRTLPQGLPLRFSGVFCSCAGGTLFSL